MKRGIKKGISPVVATVLLIALVVIIALIIFLWFRGMVQEGVTKFGQNIKLVCEDVDFDISYSATTGILTVVNNGNIPIYKLRMKMSSANNGNFETKDITDVDAETGAGMWPKEGLNQGGAYSSPSIKSYVGSYNTMIVYPILMGTSSKGKKTFVCEGLYGQQIL